jgi:hypothetical protein
VNAIRLATSPFKDILIGYLVDLWGRQGRRVKLWTEANSFFQELDCQHLATGPRKAIRHQVVASMHVSGADNLA